MRGGLGGRGWVWGDIECIEWGKSENIEMQKIWGLRIKDCGGLFAG